MAERLTHISARRFLPAVLLAVLSFGHFFVFPLTVAYNYFPDYGWHAYIAFQSSLGRLPYLDYPFIYGPLMPLLYGVGLKFMGHSLASLYKVWILVGVLIFLVVFFCGRRAKLGDSLSALLGACLFVPFTYDKNTENHIGAVLPLAVLAFLMIQQISSSREELNSARIGKRQPIRLYSIFACLLFVTLVKVNIGITSSLVTIPFLFLFSDRRLFWKAFFVFIGACFMFFLLPFVFNDRLHFVSSFPWAPGRHLASHGWPFQGLMSYLLDLARLRISYGYFHGFFFQHEWVVLLVLSQALYFMWDLRWRSLTRSEKLRKITVCWLILVQLANMHEYLLRGASFSLPFWILPTSFVGLLWLAQAAPLWKRDLITGALMIFFLIHVSQKWYRAQLQEGTLLNIPAANTRIVFGSDEKTMKELLEGVYTSINRWTRADEPVLIYPYDPMVAFLAAKSMGTRFCCEFFSDKIAIEQAIVSEIQASQVKSVYLSSVGNYNIDLPDIESPLGKYLSEGFAKVQDYGGGQYRMAQYLRRY